MKKIPKRLKAAGNGMFLMRLSLQKNNGSTLIELMIVLLLISIIASMAAPSFNLAIKKSNLESSVNDIFSLLQYAKSEALKRKKTIRVCSSTDGENCSTSTAWSGKKILVQTSSDTSTALLRVMSLNKNIVVSNNVNEIKFESDGSLEKTIELSFTTLGCEISEKGKILLKVSQAGFFSRVRGNCNANA